MSNLDERDAMLKFMGNIFGQAKKIDQDVVEGGNNIAPIHRDIQTAFERELRAPRPGPVVIPPTPQEIAASGVIPPTPPDYMLGTLPTAPPVVDVVPPQPVVQHSYVPNTVVWPDTSQINLPPQAPLVIGPQYAYPVDKSLEILSLLNTILDKLKIIELQNGQTTTRKPKSTRTIPRRSTKDK